MNTYFSPIRVVLLLAFLSVSVLPGASCQSDVVNSHVAGSATGSGPSGGIQVIPGTGATWPTTSNTASNQMFVAINGYRLSKGLKQLEWHNGISEVTQIHNNDMINRGFFSIVNPNGVDPYERMVSSIPRIDFDNAYAFITQFNNGGVESATPVFNALIDNTASRNVIENPNVTHFGGYHNASFQLGTWVFAENARP